MSRVLLLALAEWVCALWQTDAQAKRLVSDMRLFIVPTINPDGFAAHQRGNRWICAPLTMFCTNNTHAINLSTATIMRAIPVCIIPAVLKAGRVQILSGKHAACKTWHGFRVACRLSQLACCATSFGLGSAGD